jgi:hypothetical protein
MALLRAVGTGTYRRDNAIWGSLKSKKGLAQQRALAVTTNSGTSLSMDCKRAMFKVSDQFLETPNAAPLLFLS